VDLSDFPSLTLPAEGEVSYEVNALLKARAVAEATRTLALADDSGIEVDALGGRPGVLSARYGGEGLHDEDRWRQLLHELRGVPHPQRTARYRCVVAICSPDGHEATTKGVVDGLILETPHGDGGFGYDPIFYYPPLEATFAEVAAEVKHVVSHRAQAMRRARHILIEWAAEDSR
jgi:XTP/dITP diphosphohydrolase